MNISRKEFLEALGLTAAASTLSGCKFCDCTPPIKGQIALQLYSISKYVNGQKDKNGKVLVAGRGLERTLDDVAAIGFKGVEFFGGSCFGHEAKDVRRMLAASGLKACGIHVDASAYGLDTKAWTYNPEVLKKTCDFNLGFGNNLVICPGGGNFPPGASWSTGRGGEPCAPSQAIDDFTKKLAEYYNKVAADAAKMGCRIGIHNHTWEHCIFMQDGTSFWDYFFTNTDPAVCMEQDVGWTTCAGDTISGVNPMVQYKKYPHRAPTLHAKENGMGKDVKKFDAILGQPGCDADGKRCATPVDWDALVPVAEADGVQWWVVECERHFEDLSAVTPSYNFLKSKGLN